MDLLRASLRDGMWGEGLLVPKLCLGTTIVKLRFIGEKSFKNKDFQAGAWESEKVSGLNGGFSITAWEVSTY
ncbi:MAG: hypothetical protein D3922_11550 [Candidatus Electrothrix sp. AR1]|nr:hypothetical protein [Candidatus Electrothrix sp. AR1]